MHAEETYTNFFCQKQCEDFYTNFIIQNTKIEVGLVASQGSIC